MNLDRYGTEIYRAAPYDGKRYVVWWGWGFDYMKSDSSMRFKSLRKAERFAEKLRRSGRYVVIKDRLIGAVSHPKGGNENGENE